MGSEDESKASVSGCVWLPCRDAGCWLADVAGPEFPGAAAGNASESPAKCPRRLVTEITCLPP